MFTENFLTFVVNINIIVHLNPLLNKFQRRSSVEDRIAAKYCDSGRSKKVFVSASVAEGRKIPLVTLVRQ